MTEALLDALGKEVVVGNRYGFTTSKNGVTRVVVGTAVNKTKTRVTLKVETVVHHLYGGNAQNEQYATETVSAQACKMFPVN